MDYWKIPDIFYCGKNINDDEKYYSRENAVKRASEYNINSSQLEYGAEFVAFDMNNILEFNKGNYWMIPSDIIIPEKIAENITDYTDIYVNLYDENGELYDLSWPKNDTDPHYDGRKIVSGETNTEIKILTYNTITKWYVFFKKYYELVGHPSHHRIYKNAIDYYEKEITVKNEDLKAYYEELDRLFNARGGQEMYDWLTNNCFIQYSIPAKFCDAWGTTFLPLPEAIKWYHWFAEKSEEYLYVENLEDCKGTEDCCDCTKFVELGGHEFFRDIEQWANSFKDENGNFVAFNTNATNSASVTIPISFTNSIDDLGEMAIFSNDWKEEVDYGNTQNYGKGTVVNKPYNTDILTGDKTALNDTYIINGKLKGYEYNEYYENVFNEDDWSNYTDYYINSHPEEFASNGITAYTYSPINGKVIYNPDDSKDERITQVLPISKIENVCIDGSTYDVIEGKYVEMCYSNNSIADLKYKKKTKLQVFREGKLEYALFNGKKKYVKYDPMENVEKIYFLDDYTCDDKGCQVYSGKYVIYDNTIYLINNNDYLIFNDYTYKRAYNVADGYFDFKNIRLYVINDKVEIQDEVSYDDSNALQIYNFRPLDKKELYILGVEDFEVIKDENNKPIEVKVYYRYEKINCTIVSGYTDSKVELLRRKEITVDDMGNTLPGYFHSVVDVTKGAGQSRYNTPYDECTLDILYRAGEVSDLKPLNGQKDVFNGNIIEKIEFYYRNEFGEKVKFYDERGYEKEFVAYDDDALDKIEEAVNSFEESDDETIVGDLLCDITYYIGAVIRINNSGDGSYELDNRYHNGVKYIDTLHVSKQVGTYYLSKNRTFTFNYYELSQDIESIHVDDLNAVLTWDKSTYFELKPLLYVYGENGAEVVDNYIFNDYKWSHNNNVMIAPIFRSEINLSSSYPQNIDSNIYIDRGVNAAYEKLLKLQEIRTMEALENLGNSSSISGFKINNY